MVVSLLTSLLLAVTLTPSLAAWLIRDRRTGEQAVAVGEGGFILRRIIRLYEMSVRTALRHRRLTLLGCCAIVGGGIFLYANLATDFLPPMDEGGFVIDYQAPFGTSLAETNRQLLQAEEILRAVPEVESYSRRTGAQLGFAITEPNTGDFLVKLKPERKRHTQEVIEELRARFNAALPDIDWDFPGILADLIGDLAGAPKPIEVKLFSSDIELLKKSAHRVAEELKQVKGVVDVFDGLVFTGPTLSLKVHSLTSERFGLTAGDIAAAVSTAMIGQPASSVLDGDRVLNIRVRVNDADIGEVASLRELPLRASDGRLVKLSQVADISETPGQLELRRDDLRQDIAVTARLENRDLGSAVAEIRNKLAADTSLPPGMVEYGGLYQQQQDSFHNLLLVLVMAVLLVFTVLLIEFGSFREPVAIVSGAVLALFGTIAALWLTDTALNVVSFLGAIIGVGIVAKNGILMLDLVGHLRADGLSPEEALVRSGRRRLRPVLMTSLAAGFGMLPLAYGIGSGADMLRPLAIAVIGALCISVLLSLVMTPVVFSLIQGSRTEPAMP
jgi:multidrug efflux pump subunit AcrB